MNGRSVWGVCRPALNRSGLAALNRIAKSMTQDLAERGPFPQRLGKEPSSDCGAPIPPILGRRPSN